MATIAIKYNPRNIVVTKMLEAIMHINGVEQISIDDELSKEEMLRVKKSLKSGFSTMEELREILRK
jgi:hypothetical protein